MPDFLKGMVVLAMVVAFVWLMVLIGQDAADSKAERERKEADEAARTVEVARPVPPGGGVESHQRFQATSVGHFFAGHGNNRREILILRDAETGKEYLAVTGVGVTELWTEQYREGKHTKTRVVEE